MQVISKHMTINTITVYVYLMSCPKVHFATFNVGNSCHKLRRKRREISWSLLKLSSFSLRGFLCIFNCGNNLLRSSLVTLKGKKYIPDKTHCRNLLAWALNSVEILLSFVQVFGNFELKKLNIEVTIFSLTPHELFNHRTKNTSFKHRIMVII